MISFIERLLEIQKLNKIIIFLVYDFVYVWRTLHINPLAYFLLLITEGGLRDSLKTTKRYLKKYDNGNLAFSTYSPYFFIRFALSCNSLKSQIH